MDKNDEYENLYTIFFSHILSAIKKPDNIIDEIKKIIETSCIKIFKNDGDLAIKLNKIINELEGVSTFYFTQTKSIGAVGGAFSAGKSSFINSFMKDGGVLVEGADPSTAIPSYVTHSAITKITGVKEDGCSFSIPTELYSKIDHPFLDYCNETKNKSLDDWVNCISVEIPLNKPYLENICFVDTPGYNPGGNCQKDFDIAQKYCMEADFLIWVVFNKTIKIEDKKFLRKLRSELKKQNKNQKLYIVANCRDSEKNKTDLINEVLNNFETTLQKANIEYEGVSAYRKGEITYRKKSLEVFLQEQNILSVKTRRIETEYTGIFEELRDRIEKRLAEAKNKNSEIELDNNDITKARLSGGEESSSDEILAKLKNRIAKQKKDTKPYEENLIKINQLEFLISSKICNLLKNSGKKDVAFANGIPDFDKTKLSEYNLDVLHIIEASTHLPEIQYEMAQKYKIKNEINLFHSWLRKACDQDYKPAKLEKKQIIKKEKQNADRLRTEKLQYYQAEALKKIQNAKKEKQSKRKKIFFICLISIVSLWFLVDFLVIKSKPYYSFYNNTVIYKMNAILNKKEVSYKEFDDFIKDSKYIPTTIKNNEAIIHDEDGKMELVENVSYRQSTENDAVVLVSWYDAVQYCNWKSDKEGLENIYLFSKGDVFIDTKSNGYRLPTEKEWEFFAKKYPEMMLAGNSEWTNDIYNSSENQKKYIVLKGNNKYSITEEMTPLYKSYSDSKYAVDTISFRIVKNN